MKKCHKTTSYQFLIFIVIQSILNHSIFTNALSSSSSNANLKNSNTPVDLQLTKITIGSAIATQQLDSIPLSYASTWPVYMISNDGTTLTHIPDPSFNTKETGWVDPKAYEQLWLPEDLSIPSCQPAIGLVLKDGVPRYIFPTIETTLVSKDGGVWYNRGLNSVPLAKTWLPFQTMDDFSLESLAISGYYIPLPLLTNDESKHSKDWKPIMLPLTKIMPTIQVLLEAIANGPDELGSGFIYLIAPLKHPNDTTSCEQTLLPEEVIQPGHRVRLFLSNVDTMPTSLDPDDDSSWIWKRGECDLSLYMVSPGGKSEYLPNVYRPLYS